MAAVTIPNPLPLVLVALSEETLNLVDTLTHECYGAPVTNDDEARAADVILKRISQTVKQVEEQRKNTSRPIDAVKDQLIKAERQATEPLMMAWQALGVRVKAYADAAEARRQEAERVAREAQRVAQEAENRRADEARAEAARLAQAAADLDAPPGEAPVQVEASVFSELPKSVPVAYVAPSYRSSSIRPKKEYTMVIDVPERVPVTCGGVEVRPIDEARLKSYLKMLPAGQRKIVIDGVVIAHLVEAESFAAKG